MNLTPEQVAQVVEYLEGPAKVEEAARMLAVPFSDFSEDWTKGRADTEHKTDSRAARFYLDAMAARARCVATLRSDAQATAGTRESSDLLRLADALSTDVGPLVSDDDDVRRSPLLRVVDIIDHEHTTPDERKRLQAADANAREGMRGLLRELTARDTRLRAVRERTA